MIYGPPVPADISITQLCLQGKEHCGREGRKIVRSRYLKILLGDCILEITEKFHS